VERGQGETIIDGERYVWGKGDVFVLPPWALNEHRNTSATEDAILFSIQDTPVLEKLGLDRHELYNENGGHQQVTSTFVPKG
jgi:gentisate 1,2-dioxygenase